MLEKDEEIKKIVLDAEDSLTAEFKKIEKVEMLNLEKVLNAFNNAGLEERHFTGSTGYGHGDIGKEITNKIFKIVFNTEDAYVSPLFTSGTSGISHTLLGILRPFDTMCCISGTPYDTLKTVIYGNGDDNGSLLDYKVNYEEIALKDNNFDYLKIEKYLKTHNPKVIYIQRSRGYEIRNALTISQIEKVIKLVKSNSSAYVVVDNCYGEFVEEKEPTDVGADLMVSSMIKNIGGGIAPTGAYIAGKATLVEKVANHLTSPALGLETGSYEPGYRKFLQGLFIAPHVVSECKKVVRLMSKVFSKLGYETIPTCDEPQSDIVCSIMLNNREKLIEFCRGIQYASAVDSNACLEPSSMAGYEDEVIMASGSFTLGSSIELSCDAPLRAPYCAYFQGSLCYTHGKLALINSLSLMKKKNLL